TRALDLPEVRRPGQDALVEYASDGRIRSLRDRAGRRLDSVVLEPELLATLTGESSEVRTVVPVAEFPAPLVHAVLAAEDHRFFRHHGVDPTRIVEALWKDLTHGRIEQGASTITQQTVKNLFLTSERTWSRKLAEAQLAIALESSMSKEKILEVYLNQ